ncbi:hypothetical protein BH10ACI2_BH10ACI2_14030 [soil metagenome]
MRVVFISVIVLLASIFTIGLSLSRHKSEIVEQSTIAEVASENVAVGQPVLLELFTSEGCSSCPPADRLLTNLTDNPDIIALEFHVDYWDRLGWKDPFSSPSYTRRQESYMRQLNLDSTYTPQMIVDGRYEFVGSNRAKANETITKSSAEQKAAIDLNVRDGEVSLKIDGLKSHSDAVVFLAIAESKLSTKVGGGENSGSTLEHSSVVRNLTSIGMIKKGVGSFTYEQPITQNAGWKAQNIKYVAFVQETSSLKVLAVKQAAAK